MSGGTAKSTEPLVVSAVAPFLSRIRANSRCTLPLVVCACTFPPPSYTSILPFTVCKSSAEDLHTVNGNIEVYEGGGNVHAHTTNGNVHLELARIRDKKGATAETTNGSVLLAVPPDIQADLEARCLNGNFLSELPVTLEGSLRPREMHGRLANGGVPTRLHTVNWGIPEVPRRATV